MRKMHSENQVKNLVNTGIQEGDIKVFPAIESGDAGKVLTVNEGETGAVWAEAAGGGNLLIETLYTNPNPNTAQSSGFSVSVTFADYLFFIILETPSTSRQARYGHIYYPTGGNSQCYIYSYPFGDSYSYTRRQIGTASNNTLYFDVAKKTDDDGATWTNANANIYKVYGVKLAN